MRAFPGLLLLWFCAGVLGAQSAALNRLWWAEFELLGPLESLVVDCASDGQLRVALDLRAGERRALALPLPLYSPLGAAGLADIPFEVRGAGLGSARFVAWQEPQPNRRFENLAAGLKRRTRPPAALDVPAIGLGMLGLFLGSMILIFAARKRVLLFLPLALGVGLGLAWLNAAPRAASGGIQVLELDLDSRSGFQARSARDRLELPGQRLELQPAHAQLELELVLEAGRLRGLALAEEQVLVSLESVACPAYAPENNPGPALERVWARSNAGRWSFHGPWPAGQPLGAERAETAAPPGWLLAGLSPGKGLLVGRFEGSAESWIRILGFNPR